jgi:acyl-CoA synthetase (NDP forming)
MTETPERMAETRSGLLRDLLAPSSIAIVGASTDVRKLGGRLFYSIRRFRPGVRIIGVSPKAVDDQGEWATSLSEISGPVDQVLIAAPANATAQILREAGRIGAKTAAVFASGFGETGTDEGTQMRYELEEAIRTSGVRTLGPNCLGYVAVGETGDLVMAAWFGTLDADDIGAVPICAAPIALVSQSGGVGSMVVGYLRTIGLWPREYISTGNEYDISLVELVTAYATDPAITAIGAYVEGIPDPRSLKSAFEKARRAGKHIVCMVGGRSPAGSRAVQSHSGRLAEGGDLFAKFLQGCGARVATGPWEMALMLESAARGRVRAGGRIGLVAASGGMATVTADLLSEIGWQLPELSSYVGDAIRDNIPTFANVGNPLDVGGVTMQDRSRMPVISHVLFSDPALDMVVFTAGSMNAGAHNIAESIVEAASQSAKPCIVFWPHVRTEARRLLWAEGIPCLTNEADLKICLSGIPAAADAVAGAAPLDAGDPVDPTGNPAAVAFRLVARPGQPVSETDSKRVLQILGFEIPLARIVGTEEQLVLAAQDLGYPIVLKGHAQAVVHKAELGLVSTNVRLLSQAKETFGRIQGVMRDMHFGSDVLVEKQWSARYELLLGWSRTDLGTVMVFGTGGTGVEQIDDVGRELLPLGDRALDRLLEETVAGRALMIQMPKVAERLRLQLRRLAQVAEATEDLSYDLDVNPVAVTELGRLMVLDAGFTPSASFGAQGER